MDESDLSELNTAAVSTRTFPFALFISYSSKDARIRIAGKKLLLLRELKRALESHRISERGRFRVCSFEQDFELQDTVAEAIRARLAESESLLVICSKASSSSPYVADELKVFSDLHPEQEIIPAQLDMLPENAFPQKFVDSSMGADLRVRPGDSVREWRNRILDESHKIVAKAWRLRKKVVYDRFRRQKRNRRRVITSAIFILLMLVACSSWLFWQNRRQTIHENATRALEAAGFVVTDQTRLRGRRSYVVTFQPTDDDLSTLRNEDPNYVRAVRTALPMVEDLLNIASLSIQGVEVTDQWMGVIADLETLEVLQIGESLISDSGLARLERLDRLKILELLDTQATDAGVPYLAKLTKLATLTLGSTSVTAEGRAKLKELLPNCDLKLAQHEIAIPSIEQYLSTFGIVANHVNGRGFEVTAVAEMSTAQLENIVEGSLITDINSEPVADTSDTISVANKLRAIQCALRVKGREETIILASTKSGLGAFSRVEGYTHDRFGTQPSDIRLELNSYTCSFDGPDDDDGDGKGDIWGIPHWVSFHIKGQGNQPLARRSAGYESDSVLNRLGLISSTGRWRRDRDYDRGHMCPSGAARRFGPVGDQEANLMINICPQLPRFNRSTWLVLEELERHWADRFGNIWVVCGPIVYNGSPSETVQDEGQIPVVVPDAFFRIIVRESDDGLKVIPFVVPHTAEHRAPLTDWIPFVTSVDVIEALTNLDFFTNTEVREDVVPDASWITWLED
jgi:endonuclease G, mitochondrial